MNKWTNYRGRHGFWLTDFHGQHLRINYFTADMSGQGYHYRVTSRFSNEMFNNQFYKTLREAQEAAADMLTRHLKIRETQGLKVNWDK